MVEYSTAEDKEELKALYNLCFEGDEDFADWYFENLWLIQKTLVIRQNGRIASSLQMLPLNLVNRECTLCGCYVFAVATHPEERGKGYAGKLLESCFEICRGRGAEFCALIAREQSLLDYYSKFGFEPIMKVSECKGLATEGDYSLLGFADIPDIQKIYKSHTADFFSAERDEKYWQNQMSVYKAYGLRENGELVAYCFGDIRGGKFYGAEICGDGIEQLAQRAAFAEKVSEYTVFFPPEEDALPNGCIKALSEETENVIEEKGIGYLNLYFN